MPNKNELRIGLASAIGAYAIWGFLPLYFKLLGGSPPLVILAHRVVWSVPTVILVIALAGRLGDFWALRRRGLLILGLLVSGIAVAANWTLYIWAVTSGRILEGSLGYFINPLISFLFAALFFGERFGPLQLAALALAAAGVLNQAVAVGEFPWTALGLALTFAAYGAIRKVLPVDGRSGFLVEALWLAPAALAYLVMLPPASGQFGVDGPGHLLLLMAAGPVTATPLILFAMGARRLRVSTIAMLQFLGPSIQFAIGLAYGEPFTRAHAVTFVCIWTGAVLFTIASLHRDSRRERDAAS